MRVNQFVTEWIVEGKGPDTRFHATADVSCHAEGATQEEARLILWRKVHKEVMAQIEDAERRASQAKTGKAGGSP